MDYAAEALKLHAQQHGKIEIGTKFVVNNEDDLAVAYTPGVAYAVLRLISKFGHGRT